MVILVALLFSGFVYAEEARNIDDIRREGNERRAREIVPAPVLPIVVNQTGTIVLMFPNGQEPTVAKMPQFAYIGTQPLSKDDKILGTVHYSATGKNIYEKVLEYHEKTYLTKGWNPAKMRMLTTVKSVNKAFSTSGNVSVANTEGDNLTKNALNGVSKNTNSYMSSSGSVFPSYSKSWTDQKFDIWYFLVE